MGKKSKKGRPKKGEKTEKEIKRYPCSTCARDVGKSGCVRCSVCQMWCHTKCSGQKSIPDNGSGFVCPKCSRSGEIKELLKSTRKDKVEENELNEKGTDESKKRGREINKDDSIGTDEASPKRKEPKRREYNYKGVFPKSNENDKVKNQKGDAQTKKKNTDEANNKKVKDWIDITKPENQKKTEDRSVRLRNTWNNTEDSNTRKDTKEVRSGENSRKNWIEEAREAKSYLLNKMRTKGNEMLELVMCFDYEVFEKGDYKPTKEKLQQYMNSWSEEDRLLKV